MTKCPKCNAVERLYLGGMSTAVMPITWYDENDVMHCKDTNTYTSSFQCIKCGHRYDVKTKGGEVV